MRRSRRSRRSSSPSAPRPCTTSISCSSSCPPPSSRSRTRSSSGLHAATVGTVIAVVISYLTARQAITGWRALAFLATAPVAVPGIVLGVGLFLELHPPALRALRHAVDPARRLRHHRAAGRLPAAAVGVPRREPRSRGGKPHPRRDAAAGARPHHGAAAAHQRDRHLVLHLRRRDPRAVRRHHPVHLGDQGDLGADLRSQRVRRPRRHRGARHHHAGDHLRGGDRDQPHSRASAARGCATHERAARNRRRRASRRAHRGARSARRGAREVHRPCGRRDRPVRHGAQRGLRRGRRSRAATTTDPARRSAMRAA